MLLTIYAYLQLAAWVPECRIHPAVPDSRDFDSGFAGFARFRFWVCRIRGIHNLVLPNWPFCSSVVVRETVPTATHTLGSDGNSKQQAVLTVYASFSSVFGIVLDLVASFSCFITPFSGLLALSRDVIASFSNVSHRLGTFSHQFWA